MEYYQREYEGGNSEGEYQALEYQRFRRHERAEEEEEDQVRMFGEQKINYIDYGALRGDQPRSSSPGYHHQPANTWCRGHSRFNRCRG